MLQPVTATAAGITSGERGRLPTAIADVIFFREPALAPVAAAADGGSTNDGSGLVKIRSQKRTQSQ